LLARAEEQTSERTRTYKGDINEVYAVIWTILKYVGIAIACVVIVVVSSALLLQKYLQHRVAEARAITSLNGIDSLEAVQIGGIQQ
jgi:hypothetical protein